MHHTKFQGNRPGGCGQQDFLKIFTLYGPRGHLGHVTLTEHVNFLKLFARRLHMKFNSNWSSSFRGTVLCKC